MRARLLLLCTLIAGLAFAAAPRLTELVNPMIGTDAHGHTYPGATVPFGMVQLSPDAGIRGWDWCSGYHYSDAAIVGFAHTHLSGTGCADLGDILVLPTVGGDALDSLPYSRFSHDREHAEPGYYSVDLLTHGIQAELTTTARAGYHRYTFPATDSAAIVVDLGYGNDDTPLDTRLTLDTGTRCSGYRFSAGWAKAQKLFFSAEFSVAPAKVVLIQDGKPLAGGTTTGGKTCKAVFFFPRLADNTVLLQVGISPTSIEGARRNLETEIGGRGFDEIRRAASDLWERELSRVEVQSLTASDQATFYTALYHTMLAPTLLCDADGSYRGGDGEVHAGAEFDNYCTFSLWDTYRAAHPLYTILTPERVPDMVNSMLAFQEESGLLPVWSLQGCETWCMIGYHSVPVIVDAYLKGIQGFEPRRAFEAMRKSATQNQRGLEYYNLVAPAPLTEKLAQLQLGDLRYPAEAPAFAEPILAGWASSLAGEKITYHSSYPHVREALLARATTGEMAIEWLTDPLPEDLEVAQVTFMWPAGHATEKGGHAFDFFVNGERWFQFHTSLDPARASWVERAPNGAELAFVAEIRDRHDDLFGNMFLTIPARALRGHEPLHLKVVGEPGGSSDWFMTFEHRVQPDVRVEPVYALAEENGKQYQFVRVWVEHPADPCTVNVVLTGSFGESKVSQAVDAGTANCLLFVEALTAETPATVRVEACGRVTEQHLTLRPVTPYGYIPADKEHEAVSKALEYAYDDWCIARMAEALGETEDTQKFGARAAYYKNLFDPETGFMRGRNSDGSWVSPFDPRFGTQKQPQYTEGNAWQYSWYVPQDVPGLIALHGGREGFVTKLNSLFEHSSDLEGLGATADVSGLIGLYAHGNEPSHHIAYLYNDAGQPHKTQARVRQIMRSFYTDRPDGLCGNEDCGQMSAWYVLSALGFYPVNPAGGDYQIGTPLVKSAVIHTAGGDFRVKTQNLSEANLYVQSVTLNGKPLPGTVLRHADIVRGGTLEFVMGPRPSAWGVAP